MDTTIPNREQRRVTGRPPAMAETRYEKATAAQIAIATTLAIIVVFLLAVWFNIAPAPTIVRPVPGPSDFERNELLEEPIGIESPRDSMDDPSLKNNQNSSQQNELAADLLSPIGQMAERASNLQRELPAGEGVSTNETDGVSGSGNNILEPGRDRGRDDHREQRWVIQFANAENLATYAEQLDFFGIELGCAFPDGRVYFLRNMSSSPQLREASTDDNDNRLFLSWQGGDRVQADISLLNSAGVPDASAGTVLHFYDAATEEMLARLERDYADRSPKEIRRTYFQVRRIQGAARGAGYEFVVTEQKLK